MSSMIASFPFRFGETLFPVPGLVSAVPLTLEVTVDGTPQQVDVLEGALSPEHDDGFPGVETSLERRDDETAWLVAKSEDVPSVRAWMNAHLTWVRTIEDVLDADTSPCEVS